MYPNQDGEPRKEIADCGQPRAVNALRLKVRKHPEALLDRDNVMRAFNRNTMCVATGLLGTVILAAVVLAVQGHHPLPAEVVEKVMQKDGRVLPNAIPVALSEVVDSSRKNTNEISSGRETSVDHGFTPKTSQADVKPGGSVSFSAQPLDSTQVIRPKIPNVKHRSRRPRFTDVKMRLIALWHQSLVRTQRPR
jgi:hypothetical protein